jgi:hypothetical protein
VGVVGDGEAEMLAVEQSIAAGGRERSEEAKRKKGEFCLATRVLIGGRNPVAVVKRCWPRSEGGGAWSG